MQEVSSGMNAPECGERGRGEGASQDPRHGIRRQKLDGEISPGLARGLARRKQAVGEHQDGDEREQEDCVGCSIFAASSRNPVTFRFEDAAAYGGEHHAEENYGGGVIPGDFVGMPSPSGEAWHHEAVRDAEKEHVECTGCEDQEAHEDQNVEDSCGLVAWMFPLAEPEPSHLGDAVQRPVEAEIPLGAKQRRHAPRHDISETAEPQQMQQEKENMPRNRPENGPRDGIDAFRHCGYLRTWVPSPWSGARLLRPRCAPDRSTRNYMLAICSSVSLSLRMSRRSVRRSFRARRHFCKLQPSVLSLNMASSRARPRRSSPWRTAKS